MNLSGLVAVVAVTLATIALGLYGVRLARTTSDFLVASRAVSPTWNAAAISGEYLSAASFLGIAGLVMKNGVDMLWYPVGFAAGYLALLLFVAAPLRRSGAYTLPDFAETRLSSPRLRSLTTAFVVFIGWFYLVPQLQGAGLTLGTVTGAPYWVGAVGVAIVVTANVAGGGMRSITFVQAFQYWLKLTAIVFPVAVLLLAWQADERAELAPPTAPVFRAETNVDVRTPVRVEVTDPVTIRVDGRIDGSDRTGSATLAPGTHEIGPASVTFPADSAVPHLVGLAARDGTGWLTPSTTGGAALFGVYSLILATFLGTMGLPHVLVRFYTNPDGAAARRTTLVVLGLLGTFYLFPALYGALGRIYTPELFMTGNTDAVVLVLPAAMLDGFASSLVGGLVAAGAFAAFLSTASGLLVSVAGVLATDVLGAPEVGRSAGSVAGFRWAAVVAGAVPTVLALQLHGLDVSQVVGLAFAVAASSFCPLLVLGIWWRGLTDVGAAAGLLVGGGAAAVAVLLAVAGPTLTGWPAALVAQPAAWTVPLAFAVMVTVSVVTRRRIPANVGAMMLRLHAPESLRH
ncbi:cation acetate symporter [Cryptosporangium arvum]|uniref:Putative symporter n=1 Tax=Cryptosporangium arvum DSM 44712 TaxID=927661 RepID=A0A010ZP76_9ACTN|nr:cation acetate symporter [Cryptosporangium arvum]EXG79032.1 putative symporter [Cryptosporangium arvum DSM 44712]